MMGIAAAAPFLIVYTPPLVKEGINNHYRELIN